LIGKPEGKRPLGKPFVDGRIILKRILGKQVGFIWLRVGTDGRLL
jgi:hypothetical protein